MLQYLLRQEVISFNYSAALQNCYSAGLCFSEAGGEYVFTLVAFALHRLHGNAVLFSIGILPDARHLPRYFYIRLVCLYGELVFTDLAANNSLCKLANYC